MLRDRGVSRWMGVLCDLWGLTGTEFLLMTNTCSLRELWDQHGFCYRSLTHREVKHTTTLFHFLLLASRQKHRLWPPLAFVSVWSYFRSRKHFHPLCSQFRLKEPRFISSISIHQQHLWHNVYYHTNQFSLVTPLLQKANICVTVRHLQWIPVSQVNEC